MIQSTQAHRHIEEVEEIEVEHQHRPLDDITEYSSFTSLLPVLFTSFHLLSPVTSIIQT
jgi:hypothetical protein